MTWSLHRVLLLVACGLFAASFLLFTDFGRGVDAESLIFAGPGLVGLALVLATGRSWALLAAGVVLSLIPILVLFIFGAMHQLWEPFGAVSHLATLTMALTLLLALPVGVHGFWRARRGELPTAAHALSSGVGRYAIALGLVAVGMGLTGTFAAVSAAHIAGGGYDNIEPDERVTLTTADFAFEPKELSVPADRIVEFVIANEDAEAHTFTYRVGEREYDHLLLPGRTTAFIARFDEPGTVAFWCVPHSGGAADDGTGMVGQLTVQ